MAKISLLTVTLNNLGGLKRTHASIESQNSKDYEWLVQDGGSNDGTLKYLGQTNAQTQSKPDSGIYHAMNRLIERANSDYLLFLNAGDLLAFPDTLSTLQDTIAQHNPDFIYGDALEDLKHAPPVFKRARIPDSALSAAKYGMFTHHQSMLYKTSKIKTLRYNKRYQIAADYDFTCRFLQQNPNALHIPQPLCIFESGGISQQKSTLGRREQFQIRKNLKLCSPLENFSITTAQALNWQLRKYAPKLYWRLKDKKDKTN